MKLYLGIDGGQTATKSILADESGQVLGVGLGGPSDHFKDDESRLRTRKVLRQAIGQALDEAGLPESSEIEIAFLGMTGVAGPQTSAARTYRELVAEYFHIKTLHLDHDARSALAGAIPSMVGVITIAGTGSIAFGMNENGEAARAGGWGYLLGDEGSAYEIGRQALIAVAQERDGLGSVTLLTPLILEFLEIEDPALIPQVIYRDSNPKLRISGASGLVTQAAKQGDRVALDLCRRAGRKLGEIALAVIRKLHMDEHFVLVSGVGGVFLASDLIWGPYRDTVLAGHPKARVIAPRFSPLIGSLLLAYKQGAITISEELLRCLENKG